MTDKQEKKMIKAANKHWFDESGGYDKKDIMIDAFVEGYKQAFALYSVSQQRELLKAYAELIQNNYTHHFFDDAVEESIDRFLSN